MADKDFISDELLAAYLDGNTNKEETQQVLQALKNDKNLQEVLQVALQTDKEVCLKNSTRGIHPRYTANHSRRTR